MIKSEGDKMGEVKDMGVIGWKREETQKKTPKKNAKHENEQGQREVLQEGCPTMCT